MSNEIYVLWQQNAQNNERKIVGSFKDKVLLKKKIDQLLLMSTDEFVGHAEKSKVAIMTNIFGIEIVDLEGETKAVKK